MTRKLLILGILLFFVNLGSSSSEVSRASRASRTSKESFDEVTKILKDLEMEVGLFGVGLTPQVPMKKRSEYIRFG